MKKGEKREILIRLLRYTKPYRKFIILTLLFALLSILLSLLTPVLIGKAVDYIVGPGAVDFLQIKDIIFYLLLAIGGSALFQWLMTYCTNRLTFQTVTI